MYTMQYQFLVLDIETSTLFNDLHEPTSVWLSYGYINLYNRNGKRLECNYFREWRELRKILIRYMQYVGKRKIICFVHNLGYEFDFLIKNISRPAKMLSNSTHGVISSTLEDFPNIEFRCTYKLSNKKLSEVGKDIGFDKLESDYRFITPLDEVTEEEKEYCIRDCDVVARYISDSILSEYQNFNNIPLTKTGRVRKVYNHFYKEYVDKYGQPEWDLYPDEDCYEAELNAFAGGICISNPMFTGVICNNVYSYDISSSYPFAQLSEEYPYSIIREYSPTKEMLEEKFWIAKIRFNKIRSKYNWQWLSISKMQDYDIYATWFNGKLIGGDYCVRTITNVDFEMIRKTYTFQSIDIIEFYHCPTYGLLPEPYINTICKLAVEKSEAKEKIKKIEESDPNFIKANSDYQKVKNDFNSIYGMSVQKILQDDYNVDEYFVWKQTPKKYVKKEGKHLKRNFLFGVYVTAYARRNLLNGIIENCPQTFVYCDTDSIKYIGGTEFKDTNKLLPPPYDTMNGVSGLGRFDLDNHYRQFLTYGAKKYAFTLYNDTNVYLTVAGLPKFYGDGCEIWYQGQKIKLDSIERFLPTMKFKDCKLGKKYLVGDITFELDDNDNKVNIKNVDEETQRFLLNHRISTNGGVALFPTSYILDVTKEDKIIINQYREIRNLWLNQYNKANGTHLQEYLNLTYHIDLQ